MKVAFDTNIFIAKPELLLPGDFYLCTVVLAELQAGAPDASALKPLEVMRANAVRFGRILVPDQTDWWETGKALSRLSARAKRENHGQTPRFSPEEKVRLFNDVLLAITCRRAGVTLITDNLKDFERVASVCRVKIQSGDLFFQEAPL